MPLINKLFWYCCPYQQSSSERYAVAREVTINSGTLIQETTLFGNLVYPAEKVVRFCPVCGTSVPTPEAMQTLDILQDP